MADVKVTAGWFSSTELPILIGICYPSHMPTGALYVFQVGQNPLRLN